MPEPRAVTYLCLQPIAEGQGAHTHVRGIVDGLRRMGWSVRVHAPAATVAERGLMARLAAAMVVQAGFVLSRRRPDVLYVRHHPAAIVATWWARARGVPVVVEVNGSEDDWVLAWPVLARVLPLLRSLLRAELRAAGAVVAVTTGLADWARTTAERPELRVVIVPNGVDADLFRPGADGARIDGVPARYAVFVGELAPWQGIEDLIGAVADPAWPPELALVVAGAGVEQAKLERAASEGLPIHVLGRVPHDDVPALLAAADVVLVTSRDRAGTGIAPIKLFEAMAVGAAVVASAVPDNDRYAPGPLVAPGDPAAWARAVAELASDADRAAAIGRAGRSAAVAEHSWAARASATAEVLACAS